MRFGRLVTAVLLVLGMAAVGTTVVASPALADGCHGDYCSGRDPSTTGTGGNPCQNGARTVSATDVWIYYSTPGAGQGYEWRNVGLLELRWSDRCQTNWAKLTTNQTSYIERIRLDQEGTSYFQEKWTQGHWTDTEPGIFWTNMIYSPVKRTRATVICRAGMFTTGCGQEIRTGWV